MSRPRKADHDSVVAAARDVFWRHGYSGTSTRQIEDSTGLTRFTLQKTYGGKEAFFLDTLDSYLDDAEAHRYPDPDHMDLSDLADWFERLSEPEVMPRIGDKGCLLLDTINEFERGQEETDARIARYFECLHDRFSRILSAAVDRGEAAADLDADDKARVLVSILLGLNAVLRARTDDAFARSYTSAAAEMIRGWRAAS